MKPTGKKKKQIWKKRSGGVTNQFNGETNKNIEMQEKIKNVITRVVAAKVVQELLRKLLRAKKPTLYGWRRIKEKYFKI